MNPRVAVLGSSGFVGRAVADALARRGALVVPVTTPRLRTRARSVAEMAGPESRDAVDRLVSEIGSVDVVVIAAGLADAVGGDDDRLFGANALLPALVARALGEIDAGSARPTRLVHVSSAAVQGRVRCLDETPSVMPFSPYSRSKALGEQLLAGRPETVIFRPTSVHGAQREVTRRLVRFLRSPLASVAGEGMAPTPQVLIGNVADAIAFVALTPLPPPGIVLQPNEGMTTASLVRILGRREPRHVPQSLARWIVSTMMLLGRTSGRAAGLSRRLEVLWFGQEQIDGWLVGAGWHPVHGLEEWRRLA